MSSPNESLKILVVDDESDARLLLSDCLEDLGHDVSEAENVAEAITTYKSVQPEIVISDIKMPGEDGLSLLRQINENSNECMVIMVTGHGDKETAIQALKLGAFDFIDKPFDEAELEAAVDRALGLIHYRNKSKMAEIRALESAKLASIGHLAAGMAHEINNPLQIISGTIDLIEYDVKPLENKEEVEGYLDTQRNCVQRISHIVKGVRTYARMEKRSKAPISVHQVIEETVNMLRNLYSNDDVTIECQLSAENDHVIGNTPSLQQVLVNLLSNAKDATNKNSERQLIVSTSSREDLLTIEVKDNGGGMTEEVQAKVFEPFFSTKETGHGIGMGMSITNSLVSEMDGSIGINSTVGKGTTVSLSFPVTTQPVHQEVKEKIKYEKLSGKLLIVDDEEDLRNILKSMLKKFGFDVTIASNGVEALAKIDSEVFDLVITDINMPQMGGIELAQKAKTHKNCEKTKFIKISGALEDEKKSEAKMSDLFNGKLSKPFSKDEIYITLLGITKNAKN